ncbi:hypothetical protein [Pseudonocardia sp. GCM10023141]|uniref:hypothetical protein n=1 Tax=Pseudonocardia sp. GCM10023141 TaxID=3252653 RepID=UPI0036109897
MSWRAEGVLIAGRGRAPRLLEPLEIAQRIGSIYSLFESVQARGPERRSVVCAPDVRRDGVVATRLGVEWRHTLVRGDRFAITADIAAHDGYRLQQADGSPVHLGST